MMEVAEHYQHFGGVSPINQQNRELLRAIEQEFARQDIDLPVYWGNRNWKPMFAQTLTQMKQDGRRRSLAFFTSMFSCYSGCRQYREDILAAQSEVGPGAPMVEKVRMGFQPSRFRRHDDQQRPRCDRVPRRRFGPTDGAVHGPQHSDVDGRPLRL